MSTPSKLAGVISSTVSSPPANGSFLPALREDASAFTRGGRERALLEYLEHLDADGPGGAGDRHDRAGGHGLVPRHVTHVPAKHRG